MAVITYGGGGGLFSSLLPQILGIVGTKIGGPWGAATGSALGSLASGQSLGNSLANGANSYINQQQTARSFSPTDNTWLKPQGWGNNGNRWY